ncbi:MbcA/ParS/Xre antitoxin family protein [Ketobacter alkanivorans]|uniref:Antitoxin Xre/MbcA/ParS-like toxin-binding domain-containing protein n=1 Tax=Ketobacter alkanivorans TaxID=1917421 RepID=A0A2K9LF76_9GAMM|nr:hypothetical protein Kalk_00490 [Ketobacter alkanivorans]
MRISAITGIYGALQTLFVDESQWRGWIRKPNSDWNGLSAMDVMISGKLEDIQKVRNYLSAWTGQHNLYWKFTICSGNLHCFTWSSIWWITKKNSKDV